MTDFRWRIVCWLAEHGEPVFLNQIRGLHKLEVDTGADVTAAEEEVRQLAWDFYQSRHDWEPTQRMCSDERS